MSKSKQPAAVKESIEEYVSYGWSKQQATSLAWAEFFDEKMDIMAAKSTSFFGPEIRIDCYCKDCKDGGYLLPGTTIMWLHSHKNHSTKTFARR